MTAPYYEDDLVTLYHGDCLEITEWLAADVLVTDPPYGMAYRRGYTKRTRDDDRAKAGTVLGDKDTHVRDEIMRLWGAHKPALVFGTWRIVRPVGTRSVLIWDKGDSPGPGSMYLPWGLSHEEIYVLGSEWPAVVGGGRRSEGGEPARSASVLRHRMLVPGSHKRPDHPTPKPLSLMEALIKKCSAGVISDPCAGAGATVIAARNLGRHVIGVEMEERYCEMTAKRLSQQAFDLEGIA